MKAWAALGVRLALGAAALAASTARAGELVELPTDEDGRSDAMFISTEAERRWYGVNIALRDYRQEDDSVLLSAWPVFGFTVCHQDSMLLYSPAVHALPVTPTNDHLACMGRVPAQWLREGFAVRIPMFNARPRYARLDVSALDWQRLRARP